MAQTHRTIATWMTATLAAIPFVLMAPAVPGQNALDAGNSGDALDAGLGAGPGGGRRNSTRIEDNFRNRNLVITGNVAGGRGFRGSVGYSAEDDFRGRLGSNDQFTFRANSAFSDPQLFRSGSTMQQLRFGQNLGIIEYRRSGSAIETPSNVSSSTAVTNSAATGFRMDEIADVRLKADRFSQVSMSRNVQDSAAEPRIVGIAYDEKGDTLVLDASALRGLSIQPVNTYLQTIGLSSFDTARLRDDKMAGRGDTSRIGVPFESRFESVRPEEARLETSTTPDRVERPVQKDFQTVLEKIAERYAELEGGDINADPKVLRALDEKYKELRERLSGANRSDRNAKPDAKDKLRLEGERPLRGSDRDIDRPDKPKDGEGKPGEKVKEDEQEGETKGDAEREPEVEIAPSDQQKSAADFGVILRHGQRIERFSSDGDDRFNEIMRDAEQMLKDGQYFDAERRFGHALRFTPEHPLGAAGMGHAQIGAGLYLSASLTLQRLFTRTPEMIDVTYSEALLPTRDLMMKTAETMRGRLNEESDRRSNGFLLAYVGRQLGDKKMIEEGTNTMLAADAEDELAKLMQSVWK
jgi:hypothetical protein